MRALVAFVVGLIFAIGLGVSGMTQTHVVKGFLDIFGNWNYNLMGVMGGAIMVHAIAFRLMMKRSSPVLDTKFFVPTRKDIDGRLLLGAILFGLGWGWAGICPGPGIVSLVSGQMEFVLFVGSMLVGMKLFQLIDKK